MYNSKKYMSLLMLASLLSMNAAFAGTNYSFQSNTPQPAVNNGYNQPLNYNPNEPLKGSVVQVPAGAEFGATLQNAISSETTRTGDSVTLRLSQDFYYNNKLIAPAGSAVTGTVIEASSAKHGSMNGKLCIRFTQITTPVGTQIPISAVIKTDDNSGVLVGGTKMDVTKEYAKDLAVGSAAGALSGLVFGALAGGSVGRGAALGTAVGAGGGLVKSVWDKGHDVEIPANAGVELVLTQPITTSASNYSYEN